MAWGARSGLKRAGGIGSGSSSGVGMASRARSGLKYEGKIPLFKVKCGKWLP